MCWNSRSELRGDASAETVNLADMPVISVDAPALKLGYGIRAENTFWCKQGVLRTSELRDSLDEQIVADVAASILLNYPFNASTERLDDAYAPESRLHIELNNRLAAYPEQLLGSQFKAVFSALTETIEAFDKAPNAFRKVVNPFAGGNPVRTPFYAVFMAFFELIIRKEQTPTDVKAIMHALKNIAEILKTESHYVRTADREKNINKTIGLIQKFFTRRDPPLLAHGAGLSLDFENSLRRSKIETPRYEFKQGIYNLDDRRSKSTNMGTRIAEIACSMANIGPDATSYIFLGVADKKADADRIIELDGVATVEIGGLHVVGIDRETRLVKQTVDVYLRSLIAEIRNTQLSEPLKSALLGAVDTVEYRGLSVVRFTVPQQQEISWVGEGSFIREGSSTLPASPKQIAATIQRFTK